MNNLMLDIETLGVSMDAPLISIGAVFFEPLTGKCGDEFYRVITLSSALENSFVDPKTLQWWMIQSDSARAVLMTRLLLTYMKPYKNFLYLYEVVVTMTYKFGEWGKL